MQFKSALYPPFSPGVSDADDVADGRITDRTPDFEIVGEDARYPGTTFECSLVAKGATPAFTPCGGPNTPFTYSVTTPLANGDYVLYMRARAGSIVGDTNQMRFSVGDWGATYSVALSTLAAGAHPDLDVSITPNKAGQFHTIDMTLPKGLIGSLNSFPQCPIDNVATADCDPSTKIGTVVTAVQIAGMSGLKPFDGDVFLTEPQNPDDVAGMVINVYSPVSPFADTIIPLRMQLVDNVQTLRVFSDDIPTKVGDIHDPTKFTNFWVNQFDMHVNGSAGDPYPLLTNPTRCNAGNYTADLGDNQGNKTGPQTIAHQATGCENLPFAPTIQQDFTNPAASTASGVYTDIELPAGSASIKSARVSEPIQFGPNYASFGDTPDRCPGSSIAGGNFDESSCPPYAIVGTVSVDTPLLAYPLEGQVYLINNLPLPYLGVALDDQGIHARFYGQTDLVKVNPSCTTACQQRVQVVFDNLPDLPLTAIRMDLTQESREDYRGRTISSKLFKVADKSTASCVANGTVDSVLTAGAAVSPASAQQAVSVSGC